MASKAKRGKGKSKGCKLVTVKRKRRLGRVDEYKSRTAGVAMFGQAVVRLAPLEPVHIGRCLPDPMPCGRPEHVANWVPRLVVA